MTYEALGDMALNPSWISFPTISPCPGLQSQRLCHAWKMSSSFLTQSLATPSTQKALPPDLDTTRSFIAPIPCLTGTTPFNTQPTSPGLSLILHFSQIQFLRNPGEYLKLLGNLFLNCVYLSSALEYSRQLASAWAGLWLKPGPVNQCLAHSKTSINISWSDEHRDGHVEDECLTETNPCFTSIYMCWLRLFSSR